jgi:hypothetical protein
MTDLCYTLVSDGSSDQTLIPLLTWLLRENGVRCAIQSSWADLARLRRPPHALRDKIMRAVEWYPCNLLFIHRDSEGEEMETRIHEIEQEVAAVPELFTIPPRICVIPVKMTEAWLLFSAQAIRQAAGNVFGRENVALPPIGRLEALNDPKGLLYGLLRTASGLTGRRLKRFRVDYHARKVPDFINDFSPLRTLAAFRIMEDNLHTLIAEMRWNEFS